MIYLLIDTNSQPRKPPNSQENIRQVHYPSGEFSKQLAAESWSITQLKVTDETPTPRLKTPSPTYRSTGPAFASGYKAR